MTVFELQVDPERNAVIRRALAKRIVHQRELEDEEASTEEDESFLGNSITIARKALIGTSASPSESGSPTKKEHRPHLLHNHNHGHRRRNDHDRSRTLSGDSTHMNVKSRWKSEYLRVKSSSPSASSISALSEIIPDIAIPVITPTEAPQVVAITAVDGSLSAVTPTTGAIENDSTPTPNPGSPLSTTSRADEPDLAEKDLLSKLEELRKEKSRLFSLFRAALEKSAATSRPSATPPPPPPPPPLPPPLLSAAVAVPVQAPAAPPSASDSTTPSEKINQASISAPATSAVSTEIPSRGVKTEPSRPIGRRREQERVIDRSKLNLDIPRRPNLSSASSNSTASTPTPTSTAFALSSAMSSSSSSSYKGKRQRSNSPAFGERSNGPSGYPDSSLSNKYPRADYMGSHGRHPSSSNGLPDKPQVRPPHHISQSGRSNGGDGYYGEDIHSRSKSGPSSFASMSGGGPYRQNGPPLSYPPPPPTRIGFGNSGAGGGGGGGSGNSGRGGYYAHGDGGSISMSKLAPPPPPGRALPFSRSMMQMPHARGMGRGGFGGPRGGGGPPDRPMSSGRPGDWSRRRSRA